MEVLSFFQAYKRVDVLNASLHCFSHFAPPRITTSRRVLLPEYACIIYILTTNYLLQSVHCPLPSKHTNKVLSSPPQLLPEDAVQQSHWYHEVTAHRDSGSHHPRVDFDEQHLLRACSSMDESSVGVDFLQEGGREGFRRGCASDVHNPIHAR